MDRSVARTVKSQVAQRAAEILAGHDPAAAARYGGITLRGAHALPGRSPPGSPSA